MNDVLIIGAKGQLGSDLSKSFESAIKWDIEDINICDFDKTREMIKHVAPRIVINTAAYHNVKECEKNPLVAFKVNTVAVDNLAKICRNIDATLVHFSTDYVFDGKKSSPYIESDHPNPLNFYGLSKYAGEIAVANSCKRYYIFRLASLFGAAGPRGKGGNFIETMIKKASNNEKIEVVTDVVMSPTYTKDVAHFLTNFIGKNYPFGIYHLTNSGFCSWYQFTLEIFRKFGLEIQVESVSYKDLGQNVPRPKYSVLVSNRLPKLGLEPLRPWTDALNDYLKEKKYI
ncbi:TPA: dTDP-4-dehydrorhamnose reductase [Candidatus Bathyarchaeota archaeon]|nr:dTDP-4-dehydrorhamnose reductase [Candidatus Bathyarchaeota archaeon]